MKLIVSTLSIISLLCCGICRSNATHEKGPTVHTHLGTLEGTYKTTIHGVKYEAYLGVPYAQPIKGQHKFEVAKPVLPWKGIRQAKSFGPSCMSIDLLSYVEKKQLKVVGSEDCLNMNIYTPVRDGDKKHKLLPVIIFIHGGGFQFGGASLYGYDYLVKEGVVLITFDYRQGALGFLSTENDVVPGNMGLKDQVLLMRTVKGIIRSFNGNPNRVTLVGFGAGAISVHLHYTTKVTKGLFSRGIIINGNALNSWAMNERSLDKAKKLAISVGCQTCSTQKMVACLKNRTAEEIIMASAQFLVLGNTPPAPFGPVVERGKSHNKLIYQQPIDALISGEVHDLPLLLGIVSGVGAGPAILFLQEHGVYEKLNKNWNKYAPYLLDFDNTIPVSQQPQVSEKIRKHYLGTCAIDKSKVKQIANMMGDRWFKSSVHQAAREQAKAMKSSVRVYELTYRAVETSLPVYYGGGKNEGNSYYDILFNVLKGNLNPTKSQEDREVQKLMINIWILFARGEINKLGKIWRPMLSKSHELEYLEIAGSQKISMKKTSNYGQEKFWETIHFNENIPTRQPKH